jgi:Arc/MetJ-type ribon-helix-helix transcriptional regulator
VNNTIVSVRIPESMVRELRGKITDDHYLDLSEAVRGVVRKKWLEWKDPSAYQIKKLREDIKETVREKTQKEKQEDILKELQKIKDMLNDKGAIE